MRPFAPRRPVAWAALPLVAALLGGCGSGDASAGPDTDQSASAAPDPLDAGTDLAAMAAAAQDNRFTALYTLDTPGRAQRSVVVTVATDGTWRVDVPGAALGGTTDIAIAHVGAGVLQCTLPSANNPSTTSTCVKVADTTAKLPRRYDPRVEHLFTDWLAVFTDPRAPLSVTVGQPLTGSQGTCYAVESISAQLAPPVDPGIYCFTADGTLTAAKVPFGTLTLARPPAPAPASVDLPGPVVSGDALGQAAPPPTTPPPPAPSASATP